MKTFFWPFARVSTSVIALIALLPSVHAQTSGASNTIPVVTILTLDEWAGEGSGGTNTGKFSVSRSGDRTNALTVFYSILGSASNGVDYLEISNSVTIPAGEGSAGILVTAIDDSIEEPTEGVTLRLIQPPFASPTTYLIGSHSNATVYISDNDIILPPVVTVSATDSSAAESGGGTNTGTFTFRRSSGTNDLTVFYRITGSASNGLDYVTISNSVTFPPNESSVTVLIQPIDDGIAEPIESVTVSLEHLLCAQVYPPPPGCYEPGSPATATIIILDNDSPPPTNHPPTVQMVWPPNNSQFIGPTNILLAASANDEEDGHNISVEFFEGTNSLGFGTFVPTLCPAPYCSNFQLIWSNAPLGEFTLTAKATDRQGAMKLSEPIHISVKTNQPPELPLVTIQATDSHASEPGLLTYIDFGVFKIGRTGSTNSSLLVNYSIGGSASNGVDYTTISNVVVIPAGKTFVNVNINPLDDQLPEPTETVELRLLAANCCYRVGFPSNAVVFIYDNDPTNKAPTAHITSPTNNSVFISPANIPIVAEASDTDGDVVKVDFFAGDHFIGRDEGTNKTQYTVVWTNVLPGAYSLRAKAFDNFGAMGVSSPVTITVLGTNRSPETNFPPIVTIYASDSIGAEGTNYWLRSTNTSVGWDGTNHIATTNTATFVIRRSGPTNSSLTVNYRISGTASNGVDYETIPESVMIPAGERSKRVTILPIDDTLVECPETVILRLTEVTNVPPDYVVGWPGRAAAIIIDNDVPPPDTRLLCDGNFHITIPATNGFIYRLEVSHDLKNWMPVCTNTVNDAGIYFTDPETEDFLNRFYRIVGETAAPQP